MNPIMLGRSLLILPLAFSFLLQTTPDQRFASPDKQIIATWVPEHFEGRIEIRQGRKLLLLMDYSSSDGEHGYNLVKGAWTADSKFFVYALSNAGGHMPWNVPTDVYCRRDNTVRHLEEYLRGPVSGMFTVIDTDSLDIQGMNDIPVGKSYHCRLSRLFNRYGR